MIRQPKSKIIGTGSYGCVYRPPIPCKDYLKRDIDLNTDLLVSKVSGLEAAKKELNEHLKISKIDRDSKYTLPPPLPCFFNDRNDVRSCDVINDMEDKDIGILQYKDGGMSLHDFLKEYRVKGKIEDDKINKILTNIFPLLMV